MEQLRPYTLRDKEIAKHYFTTHGPRHKINLPKFGFRLKEFGLEIHQNQKTK